MSRLMTKPTKWHVRPAKTQISLGIRPVWSESSLSAWRKLRSLDTQWTHSEDSDQNQNQNQNCYWWHVQMTIIHQDLWWGKLVPSPYKRSEPSNRVFCSFSSRKASICKWIPISNSLGEEAALVNISISKRGLQLVLCRVAAVKRLPVHQP